MWRIVITVTNQQLCVLYAATAMMILFTILIIRNTKK